jgi:PPOX class probable F420-dependent enzyme
MLLTTFEADGAAASAPVRGVADGGRAYFWAWSGSGSVRRLRHVGAVQVTACGARGVLTYGLPLNATARLLHGAEASRAAGKLARGHPVRHRFLIPLLQWARRRQIVVCELVADAAADCQGQGPEGLRAAGRRGGHPEEGPVRASWEVGRVQTRVTDYGAAAIACIWPASGHVNPLRSEDAARRPQARAPRSARPPAPPSPGTP